MDDGWMDEWMMDDNNQQQRQIWNCVGPWLVLNIGHWGTPFISFILFLGLFFWFLRGIILDKCFRSPGSRLFKKGRGTSRSRRGVNH
jgi:hypothetical protein